MSFQRMIQSKDLSISITAQFAFVFLIQFSSVLAVKIIFADYA